MALGHLGLLEIVKSHMHRQYGLASSSQGNHGGLECRGCELKASTNMSLCHCASSNCPTTRTKFDCPAKCDGSSVHEAGLEELRSKAPRGNAVSFVASRGLGLPCRSCECVRPKVDGGGRKDEQGSPRSNIGRLKLTVGALGLAACFGGLAGLWRALECSLPPDFRERWRRLVNDLPEPAKPVPAESPLETVIYDCHGAVIATIAAGGYSGKRDDESKPSTLGKGAKLRPGDIPSWMWQAVVAAEDRRFFEHQGVDPRGVARAVLSLASRGGGSTITQQLVKNVFLSNERKWTRKLSEMLLAFVLEKQMSKWDILHQYLKRIYWGHGVYGIEGASALYFGKHPSLLTLGECAMLAGIVPAPEHLSPYRDSSRGRKPQARALRRMVEAGFLDPSMAASALDEPLPLAIESKEGTSGPWKAPYFVSEVLYELTQKYGWSEVACGGLQVHTTLDLRMQLIAEKVVENAAVEYDDERIVLADQGKQKTRDRLEEFYMERAQKIELEVAATIKRVEEQSRLRARTLKGKKPSDEHPQVPDASPAALAAKMTEASVMRRFATAEKYLQTTLAKYDEEIECAEKSRMEAAMVAIDPISGAVRVLVGGRDYYESNFNRGTQAFRSPGSTFKPVVYLTALAQGMKRTHVLMDEPFTIGGFTPQNYDLKFRGKVTLEEALLYSLNVPTVRLCAQVGVGKVCAMGKALGIETYLPYELALSLGGCEVTPLQLATVYATIASGGVYHKPHLITRVESSDGRVLEEQKPPGLNQRTVVNEGAVAELRALLQAVVERGTGRAARFGRPCAGKTGTSDDHKDVWFAGFTPELACVVWLGYDDNAPVGGMHPGTGASHAAPLWQEFMKRVHEGLPLQKFHDIGNDKHGSRAYTPFENRSRRVRRSGIRKIRKHLKPSPKSSPWKQVWDWEKASIYWEEREKMEGWLAERSSRALELQNLKLQLENTMNRLRTVDSAVSIMQVEDIRR
ncbi:hypothetical protein AXG93_2884s1110 [Marchantia polymorpha subsp. ruderalis]|uniref:peptidoglycan glycosyltransferase n=1 Tax=Marchantia polymorpha subsp. ruderalis TaxID=1480154 RepID=A0A176WKQ7_MARPO|nr:hypothetical protein AXG93_2884s1110 [Marchantia polymorpha subsp. ruderalis]